MEPNLIESNERLMHYLMLSQRNQISPILAKLLTLRNIKSEDVKNFLFKSRV